MAKKSAKKERPDAVIVVRSTIEHHLRMQSWILGPGGPRLDEYVSLRAMMLAIDEGWYSIDCMLCKVYSNSIVEMAKRRRLGVDTQWCTDPHEGLCPYYAGYGNCGGNLPPPSKSPRKRRNTNGWKKIHAAKTWREWLEADKKVVDQLTDVLDGIEKQRKRTKVRRIPMYSRRRRNR